MRVLLADPDPKVRSALRLLLENEPDMVIVGEVVTSDDLVAQAQATRANVILLDWGLPGLHANGVIDTLRAACCQVLVLSGRPEQRDEVVRAGIARFVCKGDPPEALLAALSEARCPARG